MLAIAPLGALLLYLGLGYLLARTLFGTNGIGFKLSLGCIIGLPFIVDEVYRHQIVSEYSWVCDEIHSEPIHLADPGSTIAISRNNKSEITLPPNIDGVVRSSPQTYVKEMLGENFLAYFIQASSSNDLFVPPLSKQSVSEICLQDEDENSCGNRLLSEHPVLNIVVTRPSRLHKHKGRGSSYWVWGNALGDENEVHHWTKFSIVKGSFSDGGWPFWWPWTARPILKTCTSNNMGFETWLVM